MLLIPAPSSRGLYVPPRRRLWQPRKIGYDEPRLVPAAMAGVTGQLDPTTLRVNADSTGKVYANENTDGSAAGCCCGDQCYCLNPGSAVGVNALLTVDLPLPATCTDLSGTGDDYVYFTGSAMSGGRWQHTYCLTAVGTGHSDCGWNYLAVGETTLNGYYAGTDSTCASATLALDTLQMTLSVNNPAVSAWRLQITFTSTTFIGISMTLFDDTVTFDGTGGTQYDCGATETWPATNGPGYQFRIVPRTDSFIAYPNGSVTTTLTAC